MMFIWTQRYKLIQRKEIFWYSHSISVSLNISPGLVILSSLFPGGTHLFWVKKTIPNSYCLSSCYLWAFCHLCWATSILIIFLLFWIFLKAYLLSFWALFTNQDSFWALAFTHHLCSSISLKFSLYISFFKKNCVAPSFLLPYIFSS